MLSRIKQTKVDSKCVQSKNSPFTLTAFCSHTTWHLFIHTEKKWWRWVNFQFHSLLDFHVWRDNWCWTRRWCIMVQERNAIRTAGNQISNLKCETRSRYNHQWAVQFDYQFYVGVVFNFNGFKARAWAGFRCKTLAFANTCPKNCKNYCFPIHFPNYNLNPGETSTTNAQLNCQTA